MSSANPIRHISDTALWVAVYRAQESERTNAVFRDPYARKLAGDRGMQIAAAMPFAERHSWSYIARTWLVDQVIERQVQQGTDMVINLAAGLDSRPYRMQLPASLRWVEVDLPDMLNYKQEVLGAEKPVCAVEQALSKSAEKLRAIVDDINADIRTYGTLYERQLYIVYDLGTIR